MSKAYRHVQQLAVLWHFDMMRVRWATSAGDDCNLSGLSSPSAAAAAAAASLVRMGRLPIRRCLSSGHASDVRLTSFISYPASVFL